MKNLIITATLVVGSLCTSSVRAQDHIRQQSCQTSTVQHQIDSLKRYYSSHGFSLMREASMQMESQYEMPIIVPLTQGEWYSFVYVGNPESKLHEVRMYDYMEKMVIYRKNLKKDVSANVINFTYEPASSEYHIIKPVQVHNKQKDLCGYVMLFKRTDKRTATTGK
ncbi:hypothetical protein [Flavihumibacter sp. CACIAM 22H1]|uniref:hypothetical protein n=1 Tax=Flavihumibacter sp. CACIAM 22H1 TaxID=1812911 RepID=UPI0007A90658|nr:hypothetical protein [Flavihumibacter sp. CACIAM 22H1]KYP13952.1 MAG: hypothetical protein A1D16_00980 [Flavihumibacter sp. CACIAM 22H1]